MEHVEGEPARSLKTDAGATAAVSAALPTELVVGTLHHPGLGLRHPVRLAVTPDGEFMTVTLDAIDEFGYGPDLAAAVQDWEQTIAELYRTLRTEQQRLGPAMQRLWEQLQTIVEERPCP